MKKIGIITYFWLDNPGTFLQAYSMLNALQKRFPNDRVELIDYKHRRFLFKPGKRHINLGRLIKDFKRYTIYRNIQNQYFTLSSDGIVTYDYNIATEFIEKNRYDLIVVGSDTILQLLQHHFKDQQVPVYWLSPQLSCKKVLCSASAGTLTYEQLSSAHRKALSESINNFELIGVRDYTTYALIKSCGLRDECKLQMIPDPTFTYEIDYSWVEKLIQRKKLDFSKPTVALNLLKSFRLRAELVNCYKSKGFQVISLVLPALNADLGLADISPFEWAGIYKYFDLVITDRFHGTLFSLKNLIPVVSVISDERIISKLGFSKIHDLLSLFGLEKSNLFNAMYLNGINEIIHMADAAMANFNKSAIFSRLRELENSFNSFVDMIPDVLD